MTSIAYPRGFDLALAQRTLARRDPMLGHYMRRIGPLSFDWQRPFQPVDALARSIIFQQLSGRAAATIERRLRAALPNGPRIGAHDLAAADPATLRACGVSANKQRALVDLAAKTLDGSVPHANALRWLSDAELIARLSAIHGIGRWTVEMMLMFRLGRPDVLPVDDLGVRKGAMRLLELPAMPSPKALAEHSQRWSPWRSAAAFYLWRIAELRD